MSPFVILGSILLLLLIFLMKNPVANNVDLGLHCLPMTLLQENGLIVREFIPIEK